VCTLRVVQTWGLQTDFPRKVSTFVTDIPPIDSTQRPARFLSFTAPHLLPPIFSNQHQAQRPHTSRLPERLPDLDLIHAPTLALHKKQQQQQQQQQQPNTQPKRQQRIVFDASRFDAHSDDNSEDELHELQHVRHFDDQVNELDHREQQRQELERKEQKQQKTYSPTNAKATKARTRTTRT